MVPGGVHPGAVAHCVVSTCRSCGRAPIIEGGAGRAPKGFAVSRLVAPSEGDFAWPALPEPPKL